MAEVRASAPRRGTNLPRMGDFNVAVILDAIRRSPDGLSRVELASVVGLAPQTVSNICRRLLDQNLIIEAGKEILGPGKPRTILVLNPKGMYAVGLHIDPTVITYAVLNLLGEVVAHRAHATDPKATPEQSMAAMAGQVLELIAESGVDQSRIAGLGVATPGPIDSRNGTVVNPPHLPGWSNVALRDTLAQATSLPVLVDKDVTAAAVAEIWTGGAIGTGSFLFLYLGTGLGCGIVINDEVVRGTSGNAGEIGHIITDPDGADCDCGRRGCIKSSCMPESLVEFAIQQGVPAEQLGATLPDQLTALAELAGAGDVRAQRVITDCARRVGNAVSVLTNFLDVERVVFGGPFWPQLSESFLREIPQVVAALSATAQVHNVEIVGSEVGQDVGAVGAACLVLEHTLSPHAEQLLLST